MIAASTIIACLPPSALVTTAFRSRSAAACNSIDFTIGSKGLMSWISPDLP